jgi:hypothetical protein
MRFRADADVGHVFVRMAKGLILRVFAAVRTQMDSIALTFS